MNLQNVPREDKTVKRAFVPKLDAFLFADYSQIELRVLAYYMAKLGDPSMAQAFIDGKDMHTESALGALRLAAGTELSDSQRQVGKVLNYSIVYGGGAPTLIRQLGISFSDAKEILHGYHSRWPGIRAVQMSIISRIVERGYITDLYGRHLHPDSDHKALNVICQGSASSLLRMAAVKTRRFYKEHGMESHMVNLVHDEIMLDAHRDELLELALALPVLMADERLEEVLPIPVDVAVSFTTWADKEPFNERMLLEASASA